MAPDRFDDDPLGAPSRPASSVSTVAGSAARCDSVRKVYVTADEEVIALGGVTKDFPAGAITTIIGPSGSGKSSLLRLLAGLDRPTDGTVLVDGVDVGRLSARRRRALRRRSVAYVFQNPVDNLVEYLTAREQLVLAGRLRGVTPEESGVRRLLDRLGLGHRADHLPIALSGGEQQRLAVACSVIGHPAVVVADEPTAELDSHSADQVLAAFGDLRDEGVAFLLSSHDPRVVTAADHLLRLEHGQVVESW